MNNQADIERRLGEQLPSSAVKDRKGAGGQTLSFIDQHFLLSRLIEVFGPLGFDTDTYRLECCAEVELPDGKWDVSYRATTRLSVRYAPPEGHHVFLTSCKDGSGFGTDRNKSRAAAHEKAIKEAETDSVKRAARLLGNSMGLALYDKEQLGVGDAEPEPKKARKPKAAKPLPDGALSLEDLRALVAEGTEEAKTKFKLAFPISRAHKVFTPDEAKALAGEATAKWAAQGGSQ